MQKSRVRRQAAREKSTETKRVAMVPAASCRGQSNRFNKNKFFGRDMLLILRLLAYDDIFASHNSE